MFPLLRATRILALVMAAVATWPLAAAEPKSQTSCVILPATEAWPVTSARNGHPYQIQVALPASYRASTKSYPVLYLLDSGYHFGFVKSMLESLQISGSMPEAVLVGIGYGNCTPAEQTQQRERDFLVAPRPGPFPGDSGKAPQFLSFLKEELLPRIETSYRTKAEDRTLLGMSAGAVFASHVLAVSPDLFQRYVVISPYLVGGQEAVLTQEASGSKARKDLKARIYTALGDPELPVAAPTWKAFFDALELRAYPGLRLKREVIKDLTHFEMPFTGYLLGVKEVFGKPVPLQASPKNYAAMVGRYFLPLAGLPMTIKHEGGRLWIDFGPGPAELSPTSGTHFVMQGNPMMNFAFLPGDGPQAEVLVVRQMGFDVAARRME